MQARTKAVLAVLVVSAMIPLRSFREAAASEQKLRCLVYSERNALIGNEQVYVAAKAVRFDSPTKGWYAMSVAPTWQVFLVSGAAKLFYKATKDNYWSRLERGVTDPRLISSISREDTSEKIAGVKTVKYVVSAKELTITYWADAEHNVPKKAIEQACQRAGMPTIEKMPLRITSSRGRALDTLKVSQASVPISFFQLPKGYKEVHSPEQIMLHGNQDLIKDFLE